MTTDYKLTKTDISALRKGDRIAIHLTDKHPEGLVRVIKEIRKSEREPFPHDVEHVIPCDVTVNGRWGGAPEEIKTGRAQCFELVYLYHNQNTGASNIIKTLRAGDEITFRFYPDAHSNGYVAEADLHADVLMLDVRRNGKRHSWELEQSVCPNNSARMCRGFISESYLREQERMRNKDNVSC